MKNEAVKLYIKKGTTIEILFLDGTTRKYDVLSLVDKYPQLSQLKNRKLFLNGKLFGWGGVIWNDNLDLDAEVVYEDGEIVESEECSSEIILGYIIKKERLKKELTQHQLSRIINMDQSDLSKIENGKLCPSLSTIKRIAKGLNTQIHLDIF